MKTPEKYEKEEIKKFLAEIGAWFFCPFMAGYGKSGVSDIIGCLPKGRFFSIEVKREGKGPTVIQLRRMREVMNVGGLAYAGTAAFVIAAMKRDGFGV